MYAARAVSGEATRRLATLVAMAVSATVALRRRGVAATGKFAMVWLARIMYSRAAAKLPVSKCHACGHDTALLIALACCSSQAALVVVLLLHQHRRLKRMAVAAAHSNMGHFVADQVGRVRRLAETRSAAATQAMQGFIVRRSRDVQDGIQRRIETRLESLVDTLAVRLKESLKDADMPKVVQQLVDEGVDLFLPDFKHELHAKTDEYVQFVSPFRRMRARTGRSAVAPSSVSASAPAPVSPSESLPATLPSVPETPPLPPSPPSPPAAHPSETPPPQTLQAPAPLPWTPHWASWSSARSAAAGAKSWMTAHLALLITLLTYFQRVATARVLAAALQARAFILYTLYPYDRSMWSCFRSPLWLMLTLLGMLPVVGQGWWLVLFVLRDKHDEFQLCDFILGYKLAQFFSLGVLAVARGVVMYLLCVGGDATHTCAENGPSLHPAYVAYFLLQVLLVWAAFWMLPYTHRVKRARALPGRVELRPQPVTTDWFGNQVRAAARRSIACWLIDAAHPPRLRSGRTAEATCAACSGSTRWSSWPSLPS